MTFGVMATTATVLSTNGVVITSMKRDDFIVRTVVMLPADKRLIPGVRTSGHGAGAAICPRKAPSGLYSPWGAISRPGAASRHRETNRKIQCRARRARRRSVAERVLRGAMKEIAGTFRLEHVRGFGEH